MKSNTVLCHRTLRSYSGLGLALVLLLALAGSNQAFARQAGPPGARFDLTNNRIIDGADALTVVQNWNSLYQDGSCRATSPTDRDVTGDGCVDVADVQTVLAHWDEPADPATPLPAKDAQTAAAAASFTVNSDDDSSDAHAGDGQCRTSRGVCTLRAAIEEANARPGRETITFDIRSSNGSCPSLITMTPGSPLVIDDSYGDGMMIDGYSQCGASANTLRVGGNAQIKIELAGDNRSGVNGIVIQSPNNVVRGLSIYNWDHQIDLIGAATNNHIEGNFLGTNVENTFTTPESIHNTGNQGVRIEYGASDNVIGGTTPAARNIIAGNGCYGVGFWAGVYRNRLIGNYIGLKQDGDTQLRNFCKGVDMDFGPKYNWIGGPNPGEGNVISGNYGGGMEISHGTETQFNSIVGNYFGVNAFGTRMIGNSSIGFSFEDTVNHNYAYNNVVGGNGSNGINFYVLAAYNEVHDNLIGVGPDGVTPMPNGQSRWTLQGRNGILIMGGSHHNIIRNNVIANNTENGIVLSNTSDSDHNGFAHTDYNTIIQNRFFNNGPAEPSAGNVGWGILALTKADPTTGATTYPNQGLRSPHIVVANTSVVSGTALTRSNAPCPACRIEVYIADTTNPNNQIDTNNRGEGKTLIGVGVADAAGNFTVAVSGVAVDQVVTALATDSLGNTSMFSRNVVVTKAPVVAPPPKVNVWMPLLRK